MHRLRYSYSAFRIAFFYMIMTVLTFLYFLASFRTNVVLVLVFLFIDLAFFMLMSAYWTLAEGRTALGTNLQIVSISISSMVSINIGYRQVEPSSSFSVCLDGTYFLP